MSDAFSFGPLSSAAFSILLALVAEDSHGYAIMQAIREESQGAYQIGPGTLYDNLAKLLAQGLVEEGRRTSRDEDPRRRYYRLTKLGRQVLTAEVNRLEDMVRRAKSQLRLAGGGKRA